MSITIGVWDVAVIIAYLVGIVGLGCWAGWRQRRLPAGESKDYFLAGGTLTWVPLEQVSAVRFSGPVQDTYRQAVITLTSGERLQGEVHVNFLIEGATDLGYWNMPLSKVESLNLAFD